MQGQQLFFDKRDAQYVKLDSSTQFFEICSKKKLKLQQDIPQTVIFDKGVPKQWFFNNKREIMRKNQDKLTPFQITKRFLNIKDRDVENLQQLQELIRGQDRPIAFLQKRNEGMGMTQQELINFFVEGKEFSQVSHLSEYLNVSTEVFYVEYRNDLDQTQQQFRFLKKTLARKQIKIKGKPIVTNPFNQLIKTQKQTPAVPKELPQVLTFVRSYDHAMNQKMQEETKIIVLFFEQAYRVRVKKIVPKFLIGDRIYFMGLMELFIEVNDRVYQQGMKEELMANPSFDNFLMCCKQFKKRVSDPLQHIPRIIVEEDKKISKQLYKHMIIEKCSGDFCNYKLLENNKGPLQLRQGLFENYKNVFKVQKSTLSNQMTHLPYEITQQLVIRSRDFSEEVIKLFEKYSIHLNTINPDEHHDLSKEQQYPFVKYSTDVQVLINMYKSVKICKNCFTIYSLIQQHFDRELHIDLRQNAQFKNTKTETRSESRRIGRQPYQKKNFLISTIPNTRLPATAPIKTRNTQSQIEINRLSLGYLNYQKLEAFKQPTQMKTEVDDHLWFDHSGNLISMQAQLKMVTLRRIDQNQSENQELVQKQEDIKLLVSQTQRKEQDFRIAHKEFYLLKTMKPQLLFTQSHFYYHVNLDVVRKLYQYQLNTPMQAMTNELKYTDLKDLTIEDVCNFMNYPPSTITVPMQFMIIDPKTAIPYILLESPQTIKRHKNIKQGGSGIEIIIFVQDMFESFHEYFDILAEEVLKIPNKKLLMFNTPGQAYTLFTKDQQYTNMYVSDIMDSLLFKLNEEEFINLQQDTLKLIGIGTGGFHAQAFAIQSSQIFPHFSQVVLINSISEVYDQFRTFLEQSKEIFLAQPLNSPELAFEYTNTIMNTRPLKQRQIQQMLIENPIHVRGRQAIIEGLLNSPSFQERFQRLIISVHVHYSLKNCLVNASEAEQLQMFLQDDAMDFNNIAINKKIQSAKRTVEYIEGGHSILYENRSSLVSIIQKLINS